ncbi:DNA repair protein XRCC1-like isoform X2 [Littorina saxatilis]|uniref:DNA repair protein XRCC1-like isoform X2 n=1 Tax=Littorina saxatilis TaxID=31220 RepID=UPI0038B5D6E5
MPEINIKHVVSCSSEDRNNPAENLLKAEGTHKWRTANPGEKNASVVLQFEKSSQIYGIDIGNEGSAFVEVLVGKSTSSSDSDFQVLLVSSSFMSPSDSRNNTNRNAVRIFGADKLSKTVASENWDRVKIVCTQPFNKSMTYGLSFIKFHSTPDSSKAAEKEGMKKLGAFFVKKEEDEDEIKVGTLFANKGKTTVATTPPPTGAAAVRAASRLAEEARASTSRSSDDRNSNSATASTVKEPPKVVATPKAKATRTSPKHAVSDKDSDTEEEEEETPRRKTTLKRQSTSLSSVASSRSADAPPPLKKTKTEPPKSSPAKEFSRLMEKVTFVLSGFQNPYRAELRDKATEMGATYKPDWGKGCTHLICAFTNTPKYNQVKGKGKIVSKQWINDCYKQKKLLPWRKYRLGNAKSPDVTSEEEEELTSARNPAPRNTPSAASKKAATSTSQSPAISKKKSQESDDENYGGNTDSADDTDEEIRRAQQKATKKKKEPEPIAEIKVTKPDPTLDLFADSTDEDEGGKDSPVAMDTDDGADSGLPDLPDFFADKHFFFYGDFPAAERRLLTRYIAAYDGVMEDYMNDRVKFVITCTKWDDNFEEALTENPGLIFVKPQWLYTCHNKTKLVPHQPYVVVP